VEAVLVEDEAEEEEELLDEDELEEDEEEEEESEEGQKSMFKVSPEEEGLRRWDSRGVP
jgi:hypothetical protein